MGHRLKDLREDNDYTQEYVAKILNMSQRGYSHIETGNNNLSIDYLQKLSKLYGVPLDYIIGETDEGYKPKKNKKNHSNK